MVGNVEFRLARSASDKDAVVQLRDAVYVRDQGRLADAADTAATFDRFDATAEYIVAYLAGEPVGTVKVVPDSAAGLPCDDVVDLGGLRPGNRLVEFGHLMTLPGMRQRRIGMALMREGLMRSVREHRATHILGDFFVDDTGRMRDFYTVIGFTPVGDPYPDARFEEAPLSVVGVLDIADAVRRARTAEGDGAELLRYFFGDFDSYAADLETARGR
ncbi:hypothetical protein ACZ90_68020 [Streptomyces albus subsp. albus]|nr:hypothetical protein ACZ90_68020 [Streptomyces albus subsp. albus]